MNRDGPQAPGTSNRANRGRGQVSAERSHSELATPGIESGDRIAVRERVQAIVTRHGLSALVGRRVEAPSSMPPCDEAAVSLLADLAIAGNGLALRNMFQVYVDAGWSNPVVLLDLLTPAIRLIGRFWEEDRCDFATVSLASSLMQRVVYEITDANRRPAPVDARRALIAVTPGDQHSLGAVVVSELLRANGWLVRTQLGATVNELLAEIRAGHYAAVGLSLSRTSRLDTLRETIGQIRRIRPKSMRIFVGGRVFAAGEAHAEDVGADGAAIDGPEMIGLMDDISTFVAAD